MGGRRVIGQSIAKGTANMYIDLDTEVRCGLADKPERRADMDFHNDIKGIIGCCVEHFVKGKTRCKDSLVSVHLPLILERVGKKFLPLFTIWLILPYFLYFPRTQISKVIQI